MRQSPPPATMAGVRIDDVVVANAAFVEESLIVAGGGECRIHQRNTRNHLALTLARIADAHHPWLAEAIAEDAAITAGGHISARIPARFQDIDAAVHRIALGDAAQIDAHAL